jgi:hypothetical protein
MRERFKWTIRLPIVFGVYHLVLFGTALAFFRGNRLPPMPFFVAEFPVLLPCIAVIPRISGFSGTAEGLLICIVPLFFWVLYGIIAGRIVDASLKRTGRT